jgi:hypothetical protein
MLHRIKTFLEQIEWNANHSSVWREILSRWGQADYDDPTKRQEHMDALKLEYDAQEYARKREAEYPDWGTQLNKIYDDGIDAWKTDMVDTIKAKYPKPE